MTNITRLPPPHDSMCRERHNRQECYEDCLLKRFISINRVPWSAFITEPLDVYMFTKKDLANRTMVMFAHDSFKRCHRSCKIHRECHTEFTQTKVNPGVAEDKDNITFIASMVPSGPKISVSTLPQVTLIDYIVQVGSCLGVWFGVSITSLNPLKWKVFFGIKTTPTSSSSDANNHQRKLFTNRMTITSIE